MDRVDNEYRRDPANPEDGACPLCGSTYPRRFFDGRRRYLRCPVCALVFVPRSQHLSRERERQRYDRHRNHPDDPAYRRFLSALHRPLVERLAPGAAGLDYGCGPGPTLSVMFEESGFAMSLYDPNYAPDPDVLRRRYDFVTCSETVEHFAYPDREWRRLVDLLKPGGWLGVMTGLLQSPAAFPDWHYKEDPTHVCFYSRQSIDWLAQRHRLRRRYLGTTVILMQRAAADP